MREPAIAIVFILLGLCFIALSMTCGCAIYETSYSDPETGLTHTTRMFSVGTEIPLDNAGMDIKVNADGSYTVKEGREVEGLDSAKAIIAAGAAAGAAASAAALGVP